MFFGQLAVHLAMQEKICTPFDIMYQDICINCLFSNSVHMISFKLNALHLIVKMIVKFNTSVPGATSTPRGVERRGEGRGMRGGRDARGRGAQRGAGRGGRGGKFGRDAAPGKPQVERKPLAVAKLSPKRYVNQGWG